MPMAPLCHRWNDGGSAVEHRPADLVAQPLIVQHEFADRFRKLVALPAALPPPGSLLLALHRGSTRCSYRVGSSAKFVRGDMRDDGGLAGGIGGMPGSSAQVPGRAHRMATRRASLHHFHLATRPPAGMFDRLARSSIRRPSQLEEVEHMLRAGRRPQRQQSVIRVGERPAAADRHEARISDRRKDHPSTPTTVAPARTSATMQRHRVVIRTVLTRQLEIAWACETATHAIHRSRLRRRDCCRSCGDGLRYQRAASHRPERHRTNPACVLLRQRRLHSRPRR